MGIFVNGGFLDGDLADSEDDAGSCAAQASVGSCRKPPESYVERVNWWPFLLFHGVFGERADRERLTEREQMTADIAWGPALATLQRR